jgi:amino acid adenylation domain-containing protein
VLEEAPKPGNSSGSRAFQLLLLSAKTGSALDTMSKNLVEYLKNNPGINLADMAFTLNACRSAFNYRNMTLCSNVNEAIAALSAREPGKIHPLESNSENIPVVFVFAGLGSQYVNMGLDLYKTEAVFRNEMDRCFESIESLVGYDIKDILYPSIDKNPGDTKEPSPGGHRELPPDRFNRFEIAQLLVFTFEYALSRLLIHWGIKPRAMIGYSFGEIPAACLAGVFSPGDALKMIAARGELIRTLPESAMLSVPLPFEEVNSLIFPGVSIAIDNGQSCIVSGSIAPIAAFEKKMKKKGQICMRINTSMAIHSEMMEPILNEFALRLKEVKVNRPQIPYISNVTGTWMTDSDAKNPLYWKRHLRETVRFSAGIKELIKKEKENVIFVEIGPGRDISALMGRYLENNPGKRVINLVRPSAQKVSDVFYLLNKIGILWLWGLKIDWPKFYTGEKRYRIPLPSYPFEGQRYWMDKDLSELVAETKKENPQDHLSADMSDWFYLPSWKRLIHYRVSQKKEKNPVKNKWLVFVNDLNPPKLIADRLEKGGHTVVVVNNGNRFERKDERAYTVNPGESGHYDDLFNELRELDVFPDKIVHCWGLTGTNHNRSAVESFEEFQYRGFYSLLYIVQAIGKQRSINPIRVTVLTDNLHEVVGGEPLCPAKSTILGLINSIPQEYPEIQCVNIDILLPEPGTPGEEALMDALFEELAKDHREPVIAIRNNNPWVRIFEPLHLGPGLKDDVKLRKNGVYLVTGGLGKIGLMLSELLARRAGARLVLTGRSPFPPKDEIKLKKLQQIEALGGQVLYIQADASNLEQMREVILSTEKTFGMINGVIHCAGFTEKHSMAMIQNLSVDSSNRQFQPKVYGAAILAEMFKNKELDFVWMLSSISSFLGGLGFAAYAAANVFMDTLVRRHNRLGKKRRHWLSLNWDGTNAEQSIEVFERLLSLEKVDQVIFSVGGNLQERFDQWIKLEQVKEQDHTPPEKENKPKSYPRPYHLTSKYVPPKNPDEREIATIWKKILGFYGIGMDDNFLELGGDSLKAITMLAALQKKMNVRVPLAEIFEAPTIRELSQFIKKSAKETYAAITPAEEKEYYLLSSAQKRLYFLQQMSLDSTTYNVPEIIPLPTEFDGGKIEQTFKKLIKRHESLRTSLQMVNDTPVQRIHEDVEFNLELHEVNDSRSNWAQGFIKRFIRPFDLTKPPLIRAGLIKEENNGSILIVDMHHIISDMVSHEILEKDFLALYGEKETPSLWLRYKDFSEWQQGESGKEYLNRQEKYWLKEFAGEIPVLELPYDYPRPLVQNFEGKSVDFKISEAETRALNAVALKGGGTLFMVLAAVVNILLAKLSGQEDIIIATPTVGRRNEDLGNIIGIFINTLPLRNFPAGNRTVREFLGDIKEKMLMASENQEYPFEEIVDKVLVNRDAARSPLFDVMFALQNMKTGAADPDKKTAFETGQQVQPGFSKKYEIDQAVQFDLTILALERDNGLFLSFKYCSKLFKKETVERFADYSRKIISILVDGPGIRISDIEVLSEAEKKQILVDFNQSRTPYPRDPSIHRLFEEQSEKNPHHIAVGGTSLVTYRQLNQSAHRLAGLLQEKGFKTGGIAGIMMERSIEMITALLAVLKSGGAYLPLDRKLPEERRKYMLADSSAKILLTSRGIESLSSPEAFNNRPKGTSSFGIWNLEFGISPRQGSQLAYVMYTSGSTGKPKGVMIEHGNVVRLVKNTNFIRWTEEDRLLPTGAIAFDISTFEIWGTLLNGAALYLVEENVILDVEKLGKTIDKNNISILHLVPQLFNQLAIQSYGIFVGLKYFLIGGDLVRGDQVNELRIRYPELKILHMYGPTENTTFSTYLPVTEFYRASIPIGKPIANSTVYIVDKYNKLVPIGVPGELLVGGDGVARGYLNRPELTAEKFLPVASMFNRSYMSHTSYIIYKTGDLAKWLPDGNIEFMGRIDAQVKIRGQRIELGEIENHLLKHENIKEAVVLAKENNGDKFLCAYIVPVKELEISGLREYLTRQLPDYMVPAYFISMENLPLTPTGKIDRKVLPAPGIMPTETYIPPGNDREETLCEIWSEVLGIEKEKISMDHNFFEIGGNSLNLIMLVGKMNKKLSIDIPISLIYHNPTIRNIEKALVSMDFSEKPVVLLNRLKPRKIFCFPDQFGWGYGYLSLASLFEDYSFYALIFIEDEDRVSQYADIIKEIQPHGPYVFFGHSAAGRISFQVAGELEKRGSEVSDIIFADCFFSEKMDIDIEESMIQLGPMLEAFATEFHAEFLIDKIEKKARNHMAYLSKEAKLEIIDANVHLIVSEELQQLHNADPKCWEKLTTKNSMVYNGWGRHVDMLWGADLEKNITIIRKILDGIAFEKEQSVD